MHARYPQSSFESIWHTLGLLDVSPAERLHRSLIRGHSAASRGEDARLFRVLVEENVDFLVVGLGGAALQGAPAVAQAIDLWFRDLADDRLARALRRVGARYIPPGPANPPLLAGGGAGLFDVVVSLNGLRSFAQEARRAVRVRVGAVNVRVLPLDRIIASKKATDRPKDQAILPVLEDALRVLQSRRVPAARARSTKRSRSRR